MFFLYSVHLLQKLRDPRTLHPTFPSAVWRWEGSLSIHADACHYCYICVCICIHLRPPAKDKPAPHGSIGLALACVHKMAPDGRGIASGSGRTCAAAHTHVTRFWLDHREAAFANSLTRVWRAYAQHGHASGPHGAIGYKATCIHLLHILLKFLTNFRWLADMPPKSNCAAIF